MYSLKNCFQRKNCASVFAGGHEWLDSEDALDI